MWSWRWKDVTEIVHSALIHGDKEITLASVKHSPPWKIYSWGKRCICGLFRLHRTAKRALRKNKFSFFTVPLDTYESRGKKHQMFFKPVFKVRPTSFFFFSRILLPFIESLPVNRWQTFHSAAETNLQTGARHRAGAVTTSQRLRRVGCGVREARPESWILKLKSVFRRSLVLCQHFQWRCHRGKNPSSHEGQAVLMRKNALSVRWQYI